ncbi:MAG: DNA polymerase II, partial [Candidatus Binatia bacterium]
MKGKEHRDQIHLLFHQNEVLFGHDSTPGLIAFEMEGLNRIRIFYRQENLTLSESVPFRPFLLLEDEGWLKGWKGEVEIEPLARSGAFNRLAFFLDLKQLEEAKSYLQKKSGKNPSAPAAPYLYISDPVHQYLLSSGKTHFLGLTFGELKRLQIDIETYCQPGFEFPNPTRES